LKIDFSKLEIKKASPENVVEIISLLDATAKWIQSKGINQWEPGSFEEQTMLNVTDEGEVYIAIYSGVIVGTIRLQMSDELVWGELDSDDYAYVHRLAIKPDLHGQGLGLHILRQAEIIARTMGKKGIRLDCMQENLALKKFYENTAGYTQVGSAKPFGRTARLYERQFAK